LARSQEHYPHLSQVILDRTYSHVLDVLPITRWLKPFFRKSHRYRLPSETNSPHLITTNHFNNKKHLKKTHLPVLFLHGEEDELMGRGKKNQAKRLGKAFLRKKPNVQLLPLPGANHQTPIDTNTTQKILNWVHQNQRLSP
jgi:dipeptidyl aminopeptidase/acylaminoacyl peptidase